MYATLRLLLFIIIISPPLQFPGTFVHSLRNKHRRARFLLIIYYALMSVYDHKIDPFSKLKFHSRAIASGIHANPLKANVTLMHFIRNLFSADSRRRILFQSHKITPLNHRLNDSTILTIFRLNQYKNERYPLTSVPREPTRVL